MSYPIRDALAWRVLPGLVVVSALFAASRETPWLGEWNWTTDWLNGTTLVLGPLVAGCAAFDTVRLVRSRAGELLLSTPVGDRWLAHVWGANTAVVAVLQLVVIGAGLVANAVVGAGGTADLRSVPTAVASLGAAAAVGVLIGAALRSLVAAPLAVCAVFGLSLLATKGTIPPVFRAGGVTGSMVGLTWEPRIVIGTLVCYAALVGSALVVALLLLRRHRTGRATASAAVGVLAAAAVLLGLAASPADRLVPHERAVDYDCAPGDPTVCVAAETSRGLDSLGSAVGRAAAELRDAGATVPPRWVQVVPGQDWDDDWAPLFIDSEAINAPTVSPALAARYLGVPAYCSEVLADEEPPPQDYFLARQLLIAWLAKQLGADGADSIPDGPERTWLGRPESEQTGWVVQTYAALSACDVAGVRPPF